MATNESTRDFYPENANEINFEAARKTAAENVVKDVKAQEVHQVGDETPSTIPAHPKQTETTNPEQVKLADTEEKTTETAPAAEATDTTAK